MFTGIIQDIGTVTAWMHSDTDAQLTVATRLSLADWQLGDSVAVNGCCLTVTAFPDASSFCAQLSPETLAVTTLGKLNLGDRLNLEPALRANDRLGGHIVTGHIDGVAVLHESKIAGEFRLFNFHIPEPLARFVVMKGSVAVNGVSLTINEVDDRGFAVSLIPHTLEQTNLGDLKVGDAANLETDMLGRYVERQLKFINKM
ncbi:MAG: riboflavin synthase [Mariprofundales bacterium]|nr:riboflavin synthase [Mariprofundales bacterium]